jgi:predicted extracellular nuclease
VVTTPAWILALAGCVDLLGKDLGDPVDATSAEGDDDDDDNTSTTWTSDSGWTDTTTPATGEALLSSVYDVQAGSVAEGTLVEIRDIVVTGLGEYGFYVQEQSGGERSGIWVFGGDGWAASWPVSVGDRVGVVARYDEHQGLSELDLQGAGEPVVQVAGTAPLPEPAVVAIGDLQGPGTEPWEGVPIRVEDLVITTPDAGNGEFEVGAGPARLLVDDQLHLFSRLGELPAGANVRSVVGILNHDQGAFKLEPRSDDEIEVAAVTVFDLQDPPGVPLGTDVEVYGVTVTAAAYDGVYVQDPAGGEFSGVWVYLGSGWTAVWGQVVAGDRVDVWGRATEYYDLTEIDLTSAPNPRLDVTGAAALPAPAPVAIADVGEPWEGVVIEVSDVVVFTAT